MEEGGRALKERGCLKRGEGHESPCWGGKRRKVVRGEGGECLFLRRAANHVKKGKAKKKIRG